MDRTDRYVISGRTVDVRITDDEWFMRIGRTPYAVLIGLMLLTAAVVLFLWGGGVISFRGEARRPPLLWTLIFGVPVGWLGLYGALGRRGLAIDRRRAAVRRWWGLLGPVVTRTHELPSEVRVVLRSPPRDASNRGRPTVFLYLGDRRIWVESPSNRRSAEYLAAYLAKFLGTGVETVETGRT